MKYKIAFIALFSISFGYSQNITPVAITQEMSKGAQPGITVFIANVSEDNVEDAVKDVMKPFKGKKTKIKRSDEFFLDDATIAEISSNTVDIHQIISKADNGYNYTAFFNLGGLFLDNAYDARKFDYAANIVRDVAVKATANGMEEILKSENKVLDELEKDKKNLAKDSEKLEKNIKKAKDLIKDSEQDIQDNIKLMENKAVEIEQQRQKIINLQNVKSGLN